MKNEGDQKNENVNRPKLDIDGESLETRLSDAGMRCGEPKLIYPHHRYPPMIIDNDPRVRSNR